MKGKDKENMEEFNDTTDWSLQEQAASLKDLHEVFPVAGVANREDHAH